MCFIPNIYRTLYNFTRCIALNMFYIVLIVLLWIYGMLKYSIQ